jgi:hypothetical protein
MNIDEVIARLRRDREMLIEQLEFASCQLLSDGHDTKEIEEVLEIVKREAK